MTGTTLKERVEKRLDEGLLGYWYVIAKSVDVQHSVPFATTALSRNLVLWRDGAGAVQCIEDYCPHRGARLSRGKVIDGRISCRYHGVTLDGRGVIVQVPALPGCALEGRKAINGYHVLETNDAIFAYFPSVESPEPRVLTLPYELTDGEYATFCTTSPWACSYRYVIENVADPMHGSYLHADTFTLSGGSKQDQVGVEATEDGFTVARVAQQGQNFDWAQVVTEAGALYMRVDIPYPAAGGPGGVMRVVAFVTPVDERNCRIFFWRSRKVAGLAREIWRFLFRASFEAKHWDVLEQDRHMLESLNENARSREMLYQHDIGLTRLRRILAQRAREQLEAEDARAVSR